MNAQRQAGVALITALLIVAVAASTVALMLAQQSATLDQAMMVTARAQADQYARAGLDWARGILAQDAASTAIDSLGEGWAQPITGLPVERALVAGRIEDEQGKFNLNNLAPNGRRSPDDVAIFSRLLASVGLAPELADAVVDWIDADSDLTSGAGAEDAYYLSLPRPYRAANQPMVQIEELYRVKGFDAASVAKLRAYVAALPSTTRTLINANTASAEVLAAVLPGVPRTEIARRIAARVAHPFLSTAEIAAWAHGFDPRADVSPLDVKSAFFMVHVQVAQDDVQVATDALVARTAAPGAAPSTVIIWRRPRY